MPTTQIDTPYQIITDRILALLEQGTVPWQQPWDSTMGVPRNLFSQRPALRTPHQATAAPPRHFRPSQTLMREVKAAAAPAPPTYTLAPWATKIPCQLGE